MEYRLYIGEKKSMQESIEEYRKLQGSTEENRNYSVLVVSIEIETKNWLSGNYSKHTIWKFDTRKQSFKKGFCSRYSTCLQC